MGRRTLREREMSRFDSDLPDCGWRASPDDIGDRSRYCIREIGHNEYSHLSDGRLGIGRRSWMDLLDDLWESLDQGIPTTWEVYDLHDAMLRFRLIYE